MGGSFHNGYSIGKRRFFHRHRLKTPFQCRILLYVLTVFGKSGGADDLDISPAQGRLEDIGSIHTAFGIPGPHDGMHLINKQDHVAQAPYLIQQALHAAFHLSPILGARYQSGHIQLPDLLIQQLIGGLPCGNAGSQAFYDGSLTYSRLADQTGIIFQPAVQYLHCTGKLCFPSDKSIQLPLFCLLGQRDAEGIQIFMSRRLDCFFLRRCVLFPFFPILRCLPWTHISKKLPEKISHAGLTDVGGVLIHVHQFSHLVGLLAQRIQICILQTHVFQQVIHRL